MRYNPPSARHIGDRDSSAISRSQFMGLSAAALCGIGLAPASLHAAANTASHKLQIGISTLGFSEHTNAALAKELAGAGIKVVQLFFNQSDSKFWKYNGRNDVSALTPERCKEIAAAYRDAGVAIHSIGVYTNLIHPDEAERNANLDYFEAMIKIGNCMDVHMFVSEAGHYHNAKEPEPNIQLHFQDAVWVQMVGTGKKLAAIAEKYQSKVLLEPFYRGFLASAKRLRMFMEEINSPAVRVLLDPANLIEINDLDEMFNQLGPLIECLHAKDRKMHVERGVAAGKGDVDYHRFVTLASKLTPAVPLILEYVGPKDYQDAVAHLRKVMKEAGIGEA